MNDLEKLISESNDELSPREEIKRPILNRAKAVLDAPTPVKTKKPRRLALILTPAFSFIFVVLCVATFLGLRFERYETVYLDINPSLSLTLNRFETIVDYELINEDSKVLFENTNFTNMKIDESLEIIVETLDKNNKLDNAYIVISAKDNNKNSEKILQRFEEKLEDIKKEKNYNYREEKNTVTTEEVEESTTKGVGPAKQSLIK